MYIHILLAGIFLATSVKGQEATNATCTEDPWTTNAEGLSPCALATILEGACFNGNFFLPALPPQQLYDGPRAGTSNTCQCSSVTYSVVQACAACQGGSLTPWETWIQNCQLSHVAIGSYPMVIPNITVPAWAFLDVSLNGVFDPTTASILTDLPESTLSPHRTSTSSSSSASNSGTSSGSRSGHSKNTGAIVGGVIGGIIGLSLLGIGAFILYRRRHRQQRIQEKVDLTQDYRYSDRYSLAPPRLYDPADPTTFPQSPTLTFTNDSFFTSSTTTLGYSSANSSRSHLGIPEM